MCAWLLSLTLCDPMTVAHQVPISMGSPRQEHWSELPFPIPGDLPNPRIKPESPTSPALAGGFFITWKALILVLLMIN